MKEQVGLEVQENNIDLSEFRTPKYLIDNKTVEIPIGDEFKDEN